MMDLTKHTAGRDLSEAERRQRRNAARARWAAVAGAAGTGLGVHHGVKEIITRDTARIRAGVRANLAPVIARNIAREQRFATRSAKVTRAMAGAKTVPQALKTMASKLRAERVEGLRGVRDIAANPRFDPQSGQFESADAAAADLAETLQPIADEIADLKARFRRPTRTAVAGSTVPVGGHYRRGARKTIEVTPDDPRYPDGKQTRRTISREDRLKLIEETQARLQTTTDPEIRDQIQQELDYYSRPRRIKIRTKGGNVQPTTRNTPAHIRTLEGYPDRAGVKQLRERLLRTIHDKTTAFQIAEAARRVDRLAGAKAATRSAIGIAPGRVQFLRTNRLAIIAAAAALGGAASLGLVHRLSQHFGNGKLQKAKGPSAQEQMALNLAETYRKWIDRLLGHATDPVDLTNDVASAIAGPIMQAFTEGATQPPTDSDDPKRYRIDVDFDVLNPAVRRHMADYALDRIVDISQQQRDSIRAVLMQQSVLQGIGPREVARTLRQSIGLTPYQMAVVQGYRSELVALDPAALERKLRDKRYDRTVRRAIETNTPLSEEQIDAMVDAYHRRMLALRAETIARTEAIRSTSYGAVARAQDVLDLHPELDVIKRWIATDDPRTRDTHRDLNNKEVQGMTTAFRTSAGNWLKWPVDQDGVADEVINCRCAIAFRFIPKAQALQATAV